MNEHYTMQEAVELARDNGFYDLSKEYHPIFCYELTTFANAAVARKLATLEERDASQVLAISRLEDVIGERDEVIDKLVAQLATAEKRMRGLEKDAGRYRMCRKLIKDFAPYQIDEKCDAAIDAEKGKV